MRRRVQYLRNYAKLIVNIFHLMFDPGIKGMSPETLEKISDKFYLTSTTHKQNSTSSTSSTKVKQQYSLLSQISYISEQPTGALLYISFHLFIFNQPKKFNLPNQPKLIHTYPSIKTINQATIEYITNLTYILSKKNEIIYVWLGLLKLIIWVVKCVKSNNTTRGGNQDKK